ncbi:hypothetical protein [Methylobacterium organophilum]|uniref:CopL family metal-binding regulatory protein n=1 Tax=Methylobacterium organophilum TaxID=410 RepID=A0ABQ4T4B6_METOR|nr:hypothetical protein [Methylobacterium organophilum]GJE25871.1 hypothetical protein LKMONMHP_0714 [Methylobacterium organophilum]
MSPERPLARLLAAVIVMIAACLGVSAAQAHDGHVHQGHAHHPPVPAVASAPLAGSTLAAQETVTRAAPRFAEAALRDGREAGDDQPCGGQCCSRGMTCCHSALTPGLLVTGPAPTPSAPVAALQQAQPPGLPPEALPKPPRSLA